MNNNYRDLRRVGEDAEAQQKPQQVDVADAVRRGFESAYAERHREINLKRLQSDPMLAFFILANRDPSSA